MLEKEIKILEINKEEVIKKLEELGAKRVFEGFIHDIYYDFHGEAGDKMQLNNRLFRVRKKGEVHMYTIKRKRKEKGLKVADEHEMLITDVESFSKVLEKYGMQKIREKKKHRVSFSFGGLEFDIDDYDGIPTLIEIEAKTLKEIKDFIVKLGLENNIQKTFGSRGLYEFYGLEYNYV